MNPEAACCTIGEARLAGGAVSSASPGASGASGSAAGRRLGRDCGNPISFQYWNKKFCFLR